MIEQLRETCKGLLSEGTVDVVIGYGQNGADGATFPVFIKNPDDVSKLVWNDKCVVNLTTYLTRKEIKSLGKPAIVVKGCDARALVVLEKESQIKREDIYAIGMACEGQGSPRATKCGVCDVHMPVGCDKVIGEVDNPPVDKAKRYDDLEEFLALSREDRMAYWQNEFSRCVKCYACRQVCPLCYCERCIVDNNKPQVIDTSAHLKGNFAWHITRAFHQAGRCIGCDECTRVCPEGINLRLLNQTLLKTAEEEFSFRPGMDQEQDPVIGTYSLQDKEEFIK
jgi:formate dehydrogenase (coenzyme F420) beta subunit